MTATGYLVVLRVASALVTWLVAVAARLGVPIVVTDEEPDRNGPTDSRVANRWPAGTPVLTKPTFGLAATPEILEAVRATERRNRRRHASSRRGLGNPERLRAERGAYGC
jgi:hypothetical protein